MGFIPEITCRRCGNKYSAIHSRCPSCGAPRKQPTARPASETPAETAAPAAEPTEQPSAAPRPSGGKKSGGKAAALFNSNTKWQFLFGCILIVLVIVAVIVLISASLGPTAKKPVETPEPTVEVTPPPTPTPTPTPEPTIPVTSVSISFLGSPLKEFTQRVGADPIQLKADVYPVEAVTTAKLKWRSSDESIITVDDSGLVTAVGPGWAEVIAECGGVAASCKVWVPNP